MLTKSILEGKYKEPQKLPDPEPEEEKGPPVHDWFNTPIFKESVMN